MRITFVIPTASLGGGTRVVAIYGKALMRMGHTVRIVSQPPGPASALKKLRLRLKGKSKIARQPSHSHLEGTGLDHHILDLHRPVEDSDVPDADVIIATWWETAEWVNKLSPSKGSKVYFIQHHEIFPYLPVARCKATYRMPLHKIVVARWLQEVMSAEYGDTAVDLVPNSVDRNQFFAPDRGKQSTPTVGFLYATAPFKGLDTLLSALETVRRACPDVRIISFGSQQPTDQFPLPNGVEFFFRPSQDQIRNLYSQCDVWVTASRSEGFNLPAMEAMACRTPVVSTRTGWPEEAIRSSINGILVDIDDGSGLASGIQWVLSRSDQEWRALSENAYATVASSSWENSAKIFEEALKRACRRSRCTDITAICSCL
jgi:glycosyltransferase involved in cell wall biosynthesis